MTNRKFDKGFSLLELFIVIALIGVVAAIAAPSLSAYYKTYKFNDYAYSMENFIKASKLTAMERSINVGVCVHQDTKTLNITNMNTERSGTCTAPVLNTLQIQDNFVSLSGNGFAFDPRGFAIFTGNVCVSNGVRYYKVVVDRFGGTRIEKGAGGCPIRS